MRVLAVFKLRIDVATRPIQLYRFDEKFETSCTNKLYLTKKRNTQGGF